MRQQELFLRSGLKVEGFGVFLEGFGFSPSRISFFLRAFSVARAPKPYSGRLRFALVRPLPVLRVSGWRFRGFLVSIAEKDPLLDVAC